MAPRIARHDGVDQGSGERAECVLEGCLQGQDACQGGVDAGERGVGNLVTVGHWGAFRVEVTAD